MMKTALAKLVFPQEERMKAHWDLFYHAQRLVAEDGALYVPARTVVDFAAYLNGLPYNKWKRYTDLGAVSLTLRAQGTFTLTLTGYSLNPYRPIRREYGSRTCSLDGPSEVTLDYPDVKDEFISFEISTLEGCVLYGGSYLGEFPEEAVREVNLAIATTTFRKEDYIRHNVEAIRRELLEGDDPVKDHLFLNVVDNGRTLKKEEIESDHVRLFPNKNTGGSGGFSRGMMESLHMEERITNVLLMDDDVLVLPESIRRLYTLLTVLKKDLRRAIVSGAMLELDHMDLMTEDIGFIRPDKSFCHLKPYYEVSRLENVLEANREVPHHSHTYAGWWCCCIPAGIIREKGYSLPLFVRGDDAEYGLRANTRFLTMGGICIWHAGFEDKFSANTNFYQEYRNMWIVKAATGLIPDVDILSAWKNECLRAAVTFNYGGWELLLLAIEDYMKGPEFIEQDHGEELLKDHRKYAEKLTPLSPDEGPDFTLDEEEAEERPMSLMRRARYYLTYNGQKFLFGSKHSERTGVVKFDWAHRPNNCDLADSILAVNLFSRTGSLRKKDRAKFDELMKRQKADLKRYQQCHEELEREYAKEYPYMTSEKFWRKYLGLGETK